jgi:hypothetical protein
VARGVGARRWRRCPGIARCDRGSWPGRCASGDGLRRSGAPLAGCRLAFARTWRANRTSGCHAGEGFVGWARVDGCETDELARWLGSAPLWWVRRSRLALVVAGRADALLRDQHQANCDYTLPQPCPSSTGPQTLTLAATLAEAKPRAGVTAPAPPTHRRSGSRFGCRRDVRLGRQRGRLSGPLRAWSRAGRARIGVSRRANPGSSCSVSSGSWR